MTINNRNSLLLFFLYLAILLSLISPKIFADGTDIISNSIEEKARLTEMSSVDYEEVSLDPAVEEGISIEAIWFGFKDDVAISTRHKYQSARHQAS